MLKELFDYVNPFVHSKQVRTSGFVFKCLTCITVKILVACVFILSLKQYFGEPIKCISGKSGYESYMETKCWIEGVFLDRNLFNYTRGEAIAVGVGSPKFKDNRGVHPEYIYYHFYQWVVPVLALEAFLLMIPRVLWRVWENGTMEKVLKNGDFPIMDSDWSSQRDLILKFFKITKRFHHMYFIKYLVCEILAFLILIFNMHIMQWIFNNFWTEFTPAISSLLSQNLTEFVSNSARLFPHQAKCSMEAYGYSGTLEFIDGLCFLSQNNVNEKIFVLLYFWFILVTIFAVINLFGVFVMIFFKFMRTQDIRRLTNLDRTRRSEEFCYWCSDYGLWYTLRVIHRNLSPVLFEDFVRYLIKCDDGKSLDYSEMSEDTDSPGKRKLDNLELP